MDDIACVSRSHASLAGILASSSSCHISFGHVKLTVFVTGTDFVAQMLLFNTCIHTYMPATGRAERLRKICGCGIKSADHYLVSGPSQRKYGEHTIALIVCREKNSRAWWKSKKTTQLTHKLLTRKQLALHTYIHTNLSIHNLPTLTLPYTTCSTPILHHLFSLSCFPHAIFTFLLLLVGRS